MALVIEDGTGVAEANSYVEAEAIVAYALARGVVITPEVAKVHAIKSMDYFWTLRLRGEIAYPGIQWTHFPRRGLVEGDFDPEAVIVVPEAVKLAQMQLALDSFNGVDLVPSRSAEPRLKRRKTGPIEREFFEQGGELPDLPLANAYLAAYLCGNTFGIRTYRA